MPAFKDWTDYDWAVEELIDAGTITVPDGRIGAADPFFIEDVMIRVQADPGRYRIRLVVVNAPDARAPQFAAAECFRDSNLAVAGWELILGPLTPYGERLSYSVECGVGSFGAVSALEGTESRKPLLTEHGAPQPDFARADWMRFDDAEVGGLLLFTVAPQHQICQTWAAFSEDGRPVRLMTDLGLMGLDPTQRLPWE